MAHLFSRQHAESVIGFYEEKTLDVGLACRTAGHRVYNKATVTSDATNSTTDAAKRPSGSKRSKSWVVRAARSAMWAVVTSIRAVVATAAMGLFAAIGAIEVAAFTVDVALETFCEVD
jgi:hypothetical protein